jgi:hypothetical protein
MPNLAALSWSSPIYCFFLSFFGHSAPLKSMSLTPECTFFFWPNEIGSGFIQISGYVVEIRICPVSDAFQATFLSPPVIYLLPFSPMLSHIHRLVDAQRLANFASPQEPNEYMIAIVSI